MPKGNGQVVIKRNLGRQQLTDGAMAGIEVLAARLGRIATTVMGMMPRIMSGARNCSQQVSRHGRRTHLE